MLKNYIKTAFRNLFRHKGFSLINILGLAIGLSICFLIALYIFHEISYDKFQTNSENIYRVGIKGELSGQPLDYAVSMSPLSLALNNEFPEVESAVRIAGGISNIVFQYEDNQFFVDDVHYTSPEFFKVFSYRLLSGDPEEVLNIPGSIVISEEMAAKFFGKEDPVGKVLRMNNAEDLTVTGVCEDIPTNSHLEIEALIAYPEVTPDEQVYWGMFDSYTYIMLNENTDPVEFGDKILNLPMDKMGITLEETGMEFNLFLENMTDIHLYSDLQYNMGNKGDITYIYVFSAIALFILFIAYINFINMTTAHYIVRAKEIGVRKIVGALRSKIIAQFLAESILLTLISTLIAYGLIELLLPVFNGLIGKELDIFIIPQWMTLILSIVSVITLGFLAGLYPAFYLSKMNPVTVIKGETLKNRKKSYFRNILVVVQFIISITLICSTGIIYKQLRYYENKKLGFNKEHVMILDLKGRDTRRKAPLLKTAMSEIPGVLSVCLSDNFPSSGACGGHGFFPEGYSEEKPWLFKNMSIDQDFLETFAIKLKEGRVFSEEFATDSDAILINETLAKEVNWEQPVGKFISDSFVSNQEEMTRLYIIGVLEDFHVNPLSEKIEPMVFYFNRGDQRELSLRLDPLNFYKTTEMIENKWKELVPDMPYEAIYLDEHFNKIHISERRLGRLFIYFSILAIFIASLGLFGLSSFVIQRRIKEIGIRKVMGSSLVEIMILLTKDFTKWVILANIIAWPAAYFIMRKWLENFAYRTSIDIYTFIISGSLALLIAVITISVKTIRAANSNPVNALKYE